MERGSLGDFEEFIGGVPALPTHLGGFQDVFFPSEKLIQLIY